MSHTLVVNKDGTVAVVLWTDNVAKMVERWPEARRAQVASIVTVDSLPEDRSTRDRWRWQDGRLVVLPAPETPKAPPSDLEARLEALERAYRALATGQP